MLLRAAVKPLHRCARVMRHAQLLALRRQSALRDHTKHCSEWGLAVQLCGQGGVAARVCAVMRTRLVPLRSRSRAADSHACGRLCAPQAAETPPTPNKPHKWKELRSILENDNNGYTL
jgi:hypothetical protein